MPLRTKSDERRRVELSTPGEWVEIRPLSLQEQRDITRQAANVIRTTAGPDGSLAGGAGDYQDITTFGPVERSLTAWSFPDKITPETVRCLDDADLALIHTAIADLNPPPRTPEERKN